MKYLRKLLGLDENEDGYLYFLIVSIIATVIFTIVIVDANKVSCVDLDKSRIKVIEHTTANGYGYTIIEVDSVEYLQVGDNAIIELAK